VRRRPAYIGSEPILGGKGIAKTEVGRQGVVHVAGELWQASAADPETPIPEGEAVRVVSVDGLHLTVQRDEQRV
jgi:membrane-bound ClpP family serine protease